MKLGGWMRIWVVLSVLCALPVIFLATSSAPSRAAIYNQWFLEANATMGGAMLDAEHQHFASYRVQDLYLDLYLGENKTKKVAFLKSVAESPTKSQKIFSQQIAKINAKYHQKLSSFPLNFALHWLTALGGWLCGVIVLYLIGWCIGWVRRGFRSDAV